MLTLSCSSESEKILRAKVKKTYFNFDTLNTSDKNIHWALQKEIQYGIINTETNEQIKFWFLSHHFTDDLGGTLYEFPDGERIFYSGYHCCELSFSETENEESIFKSVPTFKSFINDKKGTFP